MKLTLIPKVLFCWIIAVIVPAAFSQTGNESFPRTEIEVRDCKIEATLIPDTHEAEIAATITFLPLEATDYVVFDLNENFWVRRVLNADNIELEFEQGVPAPGVLSVMFNEPLDTSTDISIRIEYKGGFDRDRFSRMYSKDESSAYIGTEDVYLMYSAEWIPMNRFLGNRAATRIEVTVPLGLTVIGPGKLEPVLTKGIDETFIWNSDVPVLPASIVAGRYFKRELQFDDITLECFTKAENLEPMQKLAESVADILSYYSRTYGPSSSGTRYRLVEVDDRLANQHGMLGTIFITRSELDQPSPSIRNLARRVAYQWWRETIGVKGISDLWLEDGLAYYSAAVYLGKIRGEQALKEEINALAILALKFENTASVRDGFSLGYRTAQYKSVVAGKGAWVLSMLHGMLGDRKFDALIQKYISSCKGGKGSTAVFQKLAEEFYEKPLGWYFTEWIDTTGIPSLQSNYIVYKTLDGFRVSGAVTQDRDLFRMPLDVALVSKGSETIKTIELSGRSTPFDINTFSKPEKVVLDPNNKLLQNSPGLQTSVQLALGEDRRAEGNYIGAIRAYESALKLSPQKSMAHFRMAEVYYEQFNLQSAADSFRNALNGDLDPKWIEVWSYIYLGKIYDILGQRQRAMAEYTKAVNTKDDTDGAQEEAEKWIQTPFTRKRTIVGE